MAVRVLVVDDMADVRTMVGRVLTGAGFLVDQAATLAQARAAGLPGYDALVIDARLGDDRGTDLIALLAADDPRAAARCVLMTGGPARQVPPGVTVLIKPFDQAALVDAVRAAAAGSWRAAEIIGRARGYDYGTMAGFVHDGPAQEISAAILALSLIRRSLPAAAHGRIDEVEGLLASAARSLREFTGDRIACLAGQVPLADALARQTRHLLAAPLEVQVTGDAGGTRPGETAAICAAAELLLEVVASRRRAPGRGAGRRRRRRPRARHSRGRRGRAAR